jgi:tetratricopeptide (TPR) repeat protein/WD40 repeat protein
LPLQFSTDDRLLACSVEERRIRLWRVELPTAYRSFGDVGKSGKAAYPFFDVSPSGRILAVAARSAEVVEAEGVALWDVHGGRQAGFLKIGRTGAAIFHPHGDALISASDSGVYHWPIRVDPKAPDVWRVGPPRRLLAGKSEQLALSKDGRRLAVQSSGGLGTVIDLPDQDSLASWLSQESQHLVERLTGKNSKVQVAHAGLSQVALSPDGSWLATGTHNGKDVKIWDAKTGKPAKDLAVPGSSTVAFSPDGKWLVSYCYPKYRIHETGSWVLRHEIPNSSGSPIAFRADGRVLAVQMSGFKVQLLDPESAQVFATLEPPDRDQSYATHLQFSPDGSELFACTSELRLIHGWNLRQLSEQLAALGQPWELPPFDEAAARAGRPPVRENESPRPESRGPIRIVADLGEFAGFAERRQSESAALAHRKNSQSALDSREWQKALDEADLAIKDNPRHADGYYLRGRGWLGLGRSPEARDEFTQALALNSNHAEAYHYRGHAQFNLGQYEKSAADFAEALKRLPKDAHLYYMRGRARLYLLQYEQAIEDFQRVLEMKPLAVDEGGASEALAWLLVAGPENLRNADRALPLALRSHELQPEGYEQLRTLGAVEYRLGQYDHAVKTLTRAAAIAKPGPTAYDQFFLAMSYHRIGQTVKARKCYERAIEWRKRQTRLPEVYAALLTSLQTEAEELLRK